MWNPGDPFGHQLIDTYFSTVNRYVQQSSLKYIWLPKAETLRIKIQVTPLDQTHR